VKRVLIVDEASLFREYLETKLGGNNIEVATAINGLDGVTKLRNIPDLLIMDYNLSRQGCVEVLKQKKASSALAPIPVIITAQQFDQKKILELVPYNVKKVFAKPVKIDTLLATIQEITGQPIDIDKSPGIIEVHVNDDIVFVEVTEGFNRDKTDLLRFKIAELINLYQIKTPKLIVMLSGINFSFTEGPGLQKLLNNILEASGASQGNIRILTRDEFVKNFIKDRKEYEGIEVVSNLQYALDGLLKDLETTENREEQAELISDKVLSVGNPEGESVQLRFEGEMKFGADDIKITLEDLNIAVVDDDEGIRELIKHTFHGFDTNLNLFPDGVEFITALGRKNFDLILLDLVMPRADGFAVLRELKDKNITSPVIVLSAISERETVIRAFQMGVKSYLMKPIKPADIFKKILEILRVNF